ncbi:hypothetical protein LEP1GSC071_3916 [Leptospira santarosai str. JET]|nr:hypothetical protein LEP1GSC071_3916 [Leptospira santarosai str. JET]
MFLSPQFFHLEKSNHIHILLSQQDKFFRQVFSLHGKYSQRYIVFVYC